MTSSWSSVDSQQRINFRDGGDNTVYSSSESLDLGFTASNQVVKEVGLAPTEAVTPVAAYDKLSTLPLTNTHEEVASDTPTLPSSETELEATTPFELVASEATSPAAAFQSVIPTLPPAVAADATSLAAFQSAIIRTPPPAVASNATSPAAFQSAIHTPSHGSSPALVTFSSTSSDLVTENVEGGVFGSHFAALHSEFSGVTLFRSFHSLVRNPLNPLECFPLAI
ncbi:hypothetical protein YC2023_055415 [Brassica napus]